MTSDPDEYMLNTEYVAHQYIRQQICQHRLRSKVYLFMLDGQLNMLSVCSLSAKAYAD